jgi:hypothetical protein
VSKEKYLLANNTYKKRKKDRRRALIKDGAGLFFGHAYKVISIEDGVVVTYSENFCPIHRISIPAYAIKQQ